MTTSRRLSFERELWTQWWSGLGTLRRWGPLAACAGYALALLALGGFRSDHALVLAVLGLLAYGGPRSRPAFEFAWPFILTLIVYDSMRYYSDFLRGPIRVEEPYRFDLRFFGIEVDGPDGVRRLTPNEFLARHLHPALDLITGFAYLTFFFVYILVSARFRLKAGAAHARLIATQGWAFFWLNMLGYSTYYWYAAAPPWYVAEHGLGPADLSVGANPAGCIRFDELLGTQFFSGMYGRSADVFGAIPSLHVAYPLLTVFYAFWIGRLRTFTVGFYLLMCFSAVYLNHHYVLDVIWGSAYAVIIALGARFHATLYAKRRT